MTHHANAPLVTRNHLLASLPCDALAWLWPQMELVELPLRHPVFTAGQPITSVFFPETGWVSMLAVLENGDAAEVGLIGREGVAGLAALLGPEPSSTDAIWQSDGTARLLPAPVLRDAFQRNPAIRLQLMRFAQAFHLQVAQTAACNGRHTLEQRLARWLLMAHDRTERDDFPMTHEFLAMMLGVRRSGVSVAAARLQSAGRIAYGNGRLMVVDRAGLRASACECYDTVRREYERLLPFDVRQRHDPAC